MSKDQVRGTVGSPFFRTSIGTLPGSERLKVESRTITYGRDKVSQKEMGN